MEILPVITTLLIIAAILTIITIIISFVSFKRKEKNLIASNSISKKTFNNASAEKPRPQPVLENAIKNKGNGSPAESNKIKKSNTADKNIPSGTNSKNRIEVVKNIKPPKSSGQPKSNLNNRNDDKINARPGDRNIIPQYSDEKNEEMFTPTTKNSSGNKK